MITIRFLAVAAFVGMAVTIAAGFTAGDFFEQIGDIWSLAWGRVTLIDLYIGLALFGGWVTIREQRWPMIVGWWFGLFFLGNLAATLYLVRAAFTSSTVGEVLTGHPPFIEN